MRSLFVIFIGIPSVFLIGNDELVYKQPRFFNIFKRNSTLSSWRDKLDERSRMPFIFCGSAIPLAKRKFCDGHRDCADGSDETANLCKNNRCTEKEFRCNYGACISKKHICDGVFHCADGSDEDLTVCSNGKCVVPRASANTAYYVSGCNHCAEGVQVEEGTILKYQCLNYFAPKLVQVVCENSKWTPFLPKCDGNADLTENGLASTSIRSINKNKPVNDTNFGEIGQISVYPASESNFSTLNSTRVHYSTPTSISSIITNSGILVNSNSEEPAVSSEYVGNPEKKRYFHV